jgi:hypothetical protein
MEVAPMAELIFYRQVRRDGEVHTGLTINGITALELEEGIKPVEDQDPILLWWVDLRCEGKKLPNQVEEARQWLLGHGPFISEAFEALADELRVGMDYNSHPLLWRVPNPPRGVRMAIVCEAMYRSDALAIAKLIRGVGAHWQEWLRKLATPVGS